MNPTVLLIDPDPSAREILRTALEWRGYRVLESEDADDGLHLAREEHPAAVITEFLIPVFGVARCVVEELHLDPRTKGIRTLVFSTTSLPGALHRIAAAGAEYIAKPSPPRRVLRKLEQLVDAGV